MSKYLYYGARRLPKSNEELPKMTLALWEVEAENDKEAWGESTKEHYLTEAEFGHKKGTLPYRFYGCALQAKSLTSDR